MHPRGPEFLLGWVGGRGGVLGLFCSHFVTNKFPMSSQYIPQVPNVLSNIFKTTKSNSHTMKFWNEFFFVIFLLNMLGVGQIFNQLYNNEC